MGRDRRPNFVIFVVRSVLIVGGWVVVAWSRKSCLGPTEISSFVFLVQFKDGGRMVSLRFDLFISDVNQGNEDLECKKVGSRFSCMAPGMERFSLDLQRAVKKCALEVGCGGVWNS